MSPHRFVPEDNESVGHRRADRRSLAYHRAIAERLSKKRIDEARYRTFKWLREGHLDARHGEQWLELLSQPIPAIKRAITEDSQAGRDLRQNSPLAGMLNEHERRRLLEATG